MFPNARGGTLFSQSCIACVFDLLFPFPGQFKIFDTAYMCYAPADEELLLPCLKNFNRLGVANLTWRPESGTDKETKDLIREASMFQICWSCAAKVREVNLGSRFILTVQLDVDVSILLKGGPLDLFGQEFYCSRAVRRGGEERGGPGWRDSTGRRFRLSDIG